MGLIEGLNAKIYQKMREGAIEPVLQNDEKIVVFGQAEWFPKSKLVKILGVDKNLLLLTVGKQHIICLTDKRFLLFEIPKKLTNAYNRAKLTLQLPRRDVRTKSLGRKKLMTRERELTLLLGQEDETTLNFRPPFTRDAEAIYAALPRV